MNGQLITLSLVFHFISGCDRPVDIVFIIDGSESVSSGDFIQQKAFVASQTLWYPISPKGVNIGLILFSSNVSDIIHLKPYKTDQQFRDSVTHLSHPLHGTSIHLALRELRRLFINEGRKGAKKVGILITDGRSKRLWDTFKEARLLRLTGISMIAIGVGDRISVSELNGLTSDRDRFLRVKTFEELFVVSERIHELICPFSSSLDTTRELAYKKTTPVISFPIVDGSAFKSFPVPLDAFSINGKANGAIFHKVESEPDTSQENVTNDIVVASTSLSPLLTTKKVTNFTFPVVGTENITTLTTIATTEALTFPPPMPIVIDNDIQNNKEISTNEETLPKIQNKGNENTNPQNSWSTILSLLDEINHKSKVETSFVEPTRDSSSSNSSMVKVPKPPPPISLFVTESLATTTHSIRAEPQTTTFAPTTVQSRVRKNPVPSITLFSLDFDNNRKVGKKDNLWDVASALNNKNVTRNIATNMLTKVKDKSQTFGSKYDKTGKSLYSTGTHVENVQTGGKDFSKKEWTNLKGETVRLSNFTDSLKPRRKEKIITSKTIDTTSFKKKKLIRKDFPRKPFQSIRKERPLYHKPLTFQQSHSNRGTSGIKPYRHPNGGFIDRIAFSRRTQIPGPSLFGRRNVFAQGLSGEKSDSFYRREVSFLPSSEYRKTIIRGKSDVSPGKTKVVSDNQHCNNKPFARDSRYYLERIVGTKYEIRPCPDGTAYDARSCGCTIRTLVNGNRECRPELQLDFMNNFKDASGKNTAVSPSKVQVKMGLATFSENGRISVWRFAGSYIGTHLMIKVLFKPRKGQNRKQTLLGNCRSGRSLSYGIEIDTVEEVLIFTVDTAPRTPVSVKVPVVFDDWNDAMMKYDGLVLTGVNNKVRKSVPVAGDIETRSAPLFIGGCSKTHGFTGDIDEVALYFCAPQRRIFLG